MPRGKDPFDDDEDEDVEVEKSEDEEETPAKVVSTEPDENDEDDEDDEPKTEEQRGQWAAKRRERASKFKEATEAAERERQRADALTQQLAEERSRSVAAETTARMIAESQRSAQPQHDPWNAAYEDVQARRKALILEADALKRDNKWSVEEQGRLQTEWSKLDIRQSEIAAHKQLYQERQQNEQQRPQQEARQRVQAVEEQIRMRYPDIVANGHAFAWMQHTFMRAITAERKPNDWNTADQVAAETRRAFKIGNPPPAGAATQARFSGVGGGSARSTNGSGGGGKVVMGKAFQQMAEKLYPKLAKKSKALAHKKWAKEVGAHLDDPD